MSTTTQMQSFYLYMRHTDANGKSVVREHLVWDKDLFLASRAREAEQENGKQPSGAPRKAAVQHITHDQYLKERA